MRWNQGCLIALTLAMCTQRMSIAVGNILYGVSILFFLVDLYRRHKAGEKLGLPKQYKQYFLAYGLFALLVLPSVFTSVRPGASAVKYLDYFAARIWVLPILLFLDIDRESIKKALLAYVFFLGFDGLWTFGERIYTHAARLNGLGDGWLRQASIVSTVFPASVLLWLSTERLPHKAWLALSALLIVLGAVGSGTRASWVGILTTLPFILYGARHMAWKKVVAILLACACLAVAFVQTPVLRNRFISIANVTTNRSNADRVEAWKGGVRMLHDRPVTGFGPLQGGKVYLKQYRTKADKQGLGHFHNNYVQAAVDSGILGLAGLLFFTGYNLWIFRRWDNVYSLIGFCAWIGFSVVAMFDFTWGMSAAVKALWFMTGCSLRLRE
jgi:O-antigen ligase